MDAISSTTSAASQTRPTGSSARASSDYETFLLMLTTQLENQDPTDPADADELAVQLATFSGVEQQTLTNDLLSDLLQQSNVDNLAQMGSWVGMDVLASGPVGFIGTPVELELSVPALADKAELVVYNSAGAVVERASLDKDARSLLWQGTTASGSVLPEGQYRFEVEASSFGEALPTEQVAAYRKIAEVRTDGGDTQLISQGGDQISADELRAVRRE